jgi:hypothetical protein
VGKREREEVLALHASHQRPLLESIQVGQNEDLFEFPVSHSLFVLPTGVSLSSPKTCLG